MPKPGPDPTASDEEVIEEILTSYSPVSQPKELAEAFKISNTAILRKLNDMEDRGLLESEKVGRARVFWVTDDGKKYLEQA